MPGIRERKKQQTRETITREALRLFRKRGFEATTIADIAEAAEIAPRTFFSYFETKEAVVFHDFDDLLGRLRGRLEGRAVGVTTFDALRDWVAELVEAGLVTAPAERARRELVRSTPALRAREGVNRLAFERLVAASVAADLGVEPESLRPRMVAAAAVAALSELAELEPGEGEDPMLHVDEAIAFLQGGLETLTG